MINNTYVVPASAADSSAGGQGAGETHTENNRCIRADRKAYSLREAGDDCCNNAAQP